MQEHRHDHAGIVGRDHGYGRRGRHYHKQTTAGQEDPQEEEIIAPLDGFETRVYLLDGLDCANCAAKIEAKIQAMPEVEAASVVFAARQLRVSARSHEGLLEKMQELVDAVEVGVTLVPRQTNRPAPKTHVP